MLGSSRPAETADMKTDDECQHLTKEASTRFIKPAKEPVPVSLSFWGPDLPRNSNGSLFEAICFSNEVGVQDFQQFYVQQKKPSPPGSK